MRSNVLNLDNKGANKFFLDPRIYSTIELPKYYNFKSILKDITDELKGASVGKNELKEAKRLDNVNHCIFDNKDGKYEWRKMQLLNPYLYVSLVNIISKEFSWKLFQNRFNELSCPYIKCMSIPVLPDPNQKQSASQASEWFELVEKESIKLALDFEFIFVTDIVNCYGSLYTHSIAWALHDRKEAKEKIGDESLLGNKIDNHLRAMSNGQTNGIPQGNILMNFLAELVLAYADQQLFQRINKEQDIRREGYMILRYRDDYRIFVRNPHHGEKIMKLLSITLAEIGMNLNTGKTRRSEEIIMDSIKDDKFYTMHYPSFSRSSYKSIRDELLLIYKIGVDYPNSGSINKRLTLLNNKVHSEYLKKEQKEFISILMNIAFGSPRAFPLVAALISKCISYLSETAKKKIFAQVLRKIKLLPNAGILEIWFQRIAIKSRFKYDYDETLCKIVQGEHVELFNTQWIKNAKIKSEIDNTEYVDIKIINSLEAIINKREVSLFIPSVY